MTYHLLFDEKFFRPKGTLSMQRRATRGEPSMSSTFVLIISGVCRLYAGWMRNPRAKLTDTMIGNSSASSTRFWCRRWDCSSSSSSSGGSRRGYKTSTIHVSSVWTWTLPHSNGRWVARVLRALSKYSNVYTRSRVHGEQVRRRNHYIEETNTKPISAGCTNPQGSKSPSRWNKTILLGFRSTSCRRCLPILKRLRRVRLQKISSFLLGFVTKSSGASQRHLDILPKCSRCTRTTSNAMDSSVIW